MLRLALLAGLLALRPLLAESASFQLVDAKQQPIADAVVSLIPLDAPAPAPQRALTDREAWMELAALVPQAFADQPEAVQSALVRAFRQQAA